MARPDFTETENALIQAVRAGAANHYSRMSMFGYLVGSLLLAGFGIANGSILMLAAALVVVCGFRIYEELIYSRAIPIWRSIFDKYDSAFEEESP